MAPWLTLNFEKAPSGMFGLLFTLLPESILIHNYRLLIELFIQRPGHELKIHDFIFDQADQVL